MELVSQWAERIFTAFHHSLILALLHSCVLDFSVPNFDGSQITVPHLSSYHSDFGRIVSSVIQCYYIGLPDNKSTEIDLMHLIFRKLSYFEIISLWIFFLILFYFLSYCFIQVVLISSFLLSFYWKLKFLIYFFSNYAVSKLFRLLINFLKTFYPKLMSPITCSLWIFIPEGYYVTNPIIIRLLSKHWILHPSLNGISSFDL